MRLNNIQLEFRRDGDGITCHLPGKARVLARIEPDATYPRMWRVRFPDGRLSGMVNKARAKDVAWGIAESAVYIEGRHVEGRHAA
jgi:hypothetical protein